MNERKTLAVAVSGESFSLRWLQGWTNCLVKLPPHFNLQIHLGYSTIVSLSRIAATKQLLEYPWDYLLMLDDDNPPDASQVVQLIVDLENPEIDLVAGWYRLDMGGHTALSFGRAFRVIKATFQRRYPASESEFMSKDAPDLQEIDWTGLGTVLMRRAVLEACTPAAFLPFQEGPEEHWCGDNNGFIWDDMHFCKVARAAGKRLFVDRRVKVPHLKLRDITDLPTGEAEGQPAAPSAGTVSGLLGMPTSQDSEKAANYLPSGEAEGQPAAPSAGTDQ